MLKITSSICGESNYMKIVNQWMKEDCKFIKFCFEIKCVDVNRCKLNGQSEKKLGGN